MFCKTITMQNKIEIIRNAWDKMLINLIQQYRAINDEGMQKIVMEFAKIKVDVKDFVIANFMR